VKYCTLPRFPYNIYIHIGWWFRHWNIWIIFPSYWECHHPNWRTHILQRGGSTTNQIYTIMKSHWISKVNRLYPMKIPTSPQARALNPQGWRTLFRLYGQSLDPSGGAWSNVCWEPTMWDQKNAILLLSSIVYFDGPWEKRDSWLVTGDLLPTKNPNEIIHGY